MRQGSGVGHLFMIPDPGRPIVALRPTRLDTPRGECYISFDPVPKIRGALHRTYPDSRTPPDKRCALERSRDVLALCQMPAEALYFRDLRLGGKIERGFRARISIIWHLE